MGNQSAQVSIKLHDRLMAIVQASGIDRAEELSAGLMLLIDGAFVQRRLYEAHRVNLQQSAAIYISCYAAQRAME
jgi:hypothetical protein